MEKEKKWENISYQEFENSECKNHRDENSPE